MLWLHCVLAAFHGLSLAAVIWGHSSWKCLGFYRNGFSGHRAWALRLRSCNSQTLEHRVHTVYIDKYSEITSSVQSISHVSLFVTPQTAAHQASLSITNSRSLLKLMSIESVAIQPSHPLLSPSPPALNPSQHQGLFQWVGSSHQVAKVLEFQLQHWSSQWIFTTDFL